MSASSLAYWEESLFCALDEQGIAVTDAQLKALAESIQTDHENYGLAFYSPPSSDRLDEIKREADARLERLQKEFDTYRKNAERAVGEALGQSPNTPISIGEYGEVFRNDGRTTQIQ